MLDCCLLAMDSAHNNRLSGAVVITDHIQEGSYLRKFVGALSEHYAQVSDTIFQRERAIRARRVPNQ